jgi:hypothetical protein
VTIEPRTLHGRRSFAQAYQDLFVVDVLSRKRRGTYLELGAGHPFAESNTALLEVDYAWSGLSLEFDSALHEEFALQRTNTCLNEDALSFDYRGSLPLIFPSLEIDYLSMDIDDNLPLLGAVPFDLYRFAVITFEHDFYRQGPTVMLESRDFFNRLGYLRVCSNVHTQGRDFEDWYVDPNLVPEEHFIRFISSASEARNLFDPIGLP